MNCFCICNHSDFLIFLGTPSGIDPAGVPLPHPARAWVWLVDMERACSLLIGRCLGGMLIASPLSREEHDTSTWLSTHLFSNGLHKTAVEIGMSYLYVYSYM